MSTRASPARAPLTARGSSALSPTCHSGRRGSCSAWSAPRLARNNADWHRLLELCSLSGTLICDEDGLYHPGSINDRLLLGLKGTISEAELHFVRARLQGGLLAKAARGELQVRLPVGLCYDQLGNVTLDPDAGARAAIEYLFKCFEQTGSAHAVVKQFAAEQLRFPGRHAPGGPHAGETYWKPLRHDLVLFTLHNPRYAGAYFYGRRKQRNSPTSMAAPVPCSSHATSGRC
jgi:DNA invertase Pin-like site-specific DNA recombinase